MKSIAFVLKTAGPKINRKFTSFQKGILITIFTLQSHLYYKLSENNLVFAIMQSRDDQFL